MSSSGGGSRHPDHHLSPIGPAPASVARGPSGGARGLVQDACGRARGPGILRPRPGGASRRRAMGKDTCVFSSIRMMPG
jgi:hypothetical protein